MAATNTSAPALEVRGLTVRYGGETGRTAVNDLNFEVQRGELLGLLGESGCGKTTTAMAILRLLRAPGRVTGGTAILEGGVDILNVPTAQMRDLRWSKLALVPQGAMSSLNPVLKIRSQIAEVLRQHSKDRQSKRQMTARCAELLEVVNLPPEVMLMYPHELSGGMKQRVCIAMGIALNPTLLIADEPTSALDVVVQRKVAQTLLDIRDRMGVAVIMIGHDVGLMSQMADRVMVMRDGIAVEQGSSTDVLQRPQHPYTQSLLTSVPTLPTSPSRMATYHG